MELKLEKSPVFSVIIPTFNRDKLIVTAINSVLGQTFQDFELIIVDDGSSDNTKQVVCAISDERIKYIYKENGGQNSALNVGLRNAQGVYVAFLDSDDIWFAEKLQKVYEKFQKDPEVAVVYHQTGVQDRNGNIIAVNNDYLEGYVYSEVLQQEYLSSQISLSCKRECFDVIGFYDENFVMYQDDDICFQLAKNFKVGLVKEVLSQIGGLASNRVTNNIRRTICDYNKLLLKYENDIIKYCGKQKLADMYYKLSLYYGRDRNYSKARENFKVIKEYDVSNKYSRMQLESALLYDKIKSYIVIIKSKLWKIYST